MSTVDFSYDIAGYLTPEGRRRAVEASYEPTLRTMVGFCPLGLAEPCNDDGVPLRSPSAEDVADAICARLGDTLMTRLIGTQTLHEVIFQLAAEFMSDWDEGRIPNLAAALGLEE